MEKKVYEGQTLTSHFRYIYDAFKLVEESSASHANYSLRCYVWQPESIDLDVVLQMNDMNESTCLFYSYDANKNIHAILDNIGHVISNYNYDSFGNIIEINGKYALINPYRFSSEFYDDDIAYNYFIYRYYCSKIGRWIARDKIEEIGGENLLAFVYNDAVNKYDVLGNSATGSITVKIAICIAKCGMKSAMKKFYLKALSDANITGKISESCVENGGVLPSWVDLTEEPFHIFVPKADVLDNLKECLIKSNIFDKTVKIESETKIMKNSNLRCDNENKNIPYTLILEIKMYAVVSGVKKELTSEQKVYNNKAGIIAWCNCCQ